MTMTTSKDSKNIRSKTPNRKEKNKKYPNTWAEFHQQRKEKLKREKIQNNESNIKKYSADKEEEMDDEFDDENDNVGEEDDYQNDTEDEDDDYQNDTEDEEDDGNFVDAGSYKIPTGYSRVCSVLTEQCLQ